MRTAFTLFELLIVMAIIGILAAIGYPLYKKHIDKVHYNRAKMALLEIANKLEEQQAISGDYSATPKYKLLNHLPSDLPYHFNLLHISKHEYLLQAIPKDQQSVVNPKCQQLNLDHKGNHCW